MSDPGASTNTLAASSGIEIRSSNALDVIINTSVETVANLRPVSGSAMASTVEFYKNGELLTVSALPDGVFQLTDKNHFPIARFLIVDPDSLEISRAAGEVNIHKLQLSQASSNKGYQIVLAESKIKAVEWDNAVPQWGPTAYVYPTFYGRIAPPWERWDAWTEAMARSPRYMNYNNMRDQFLCHYDIVRVSDPKKKSWNLDLGRPDVGYNATVRARCNPSGND